jgi:hypothetical protein
MLQMKILIMQEAKKKIEMKRMKMKMRKSEEANKSDAIINK